MAIFCRKINCNLPAYSPRLETKASSAIETVVEYRRYIDLYESNHDTKKDFSLHSLLTFNLTIERNFSSFLVGPFCYLNHNSLARASCRNKKVTRNF